MGLDEIQKLTDIFINMDLSKLTIQDQMVITAANVEMLEKIKPILLKYAITNKVEGGTFLFKM